jgi:hypothetical protein
MVNELHSIRYDKTQLSYYDAVAEARNGLQEDAIHGIPPPTFAPFISPGSFGGIRLTNTLMKVVFSSFMKVTEPYMQASFQMSIDEGLAMDHTHKFSNSIYVSGRSGRVFTASITGTGLGGEINWSRMMYTKSLSECQLLFQEYKEARLNAGVPLLKQFETDNVKSDRRFIEHHFPELKEGVVPNDKGPDGCMKATILEEQYVFINTCAAANNWAGSIINSDLLVNSPKEVLVGLDAEWNKGDTGIHLLQLSFPDHLVAVFDLQQMEVYDEPRRPFLNMLKRLLHLKCIVACGSQVGGDCGRLEQIQVNIDRRLDLKQVAIRHDSEQPHGTGLQGLSR